MSDEAITIAGVTIPMPCYGPDLRRINSENPYWTQEALRQIIKIINVSLPETVQAIGEAVDGGLDAVNGTVDGDHIWTQRGGGLPAVGEGGLGGDTVIGHVNNYGGAGTHVPGVALPPAGAPAVAVIDDIRLDPVKHVVTAEWVYAAKPFTVTTPWLTYNTGTDVLAHTLVDAGSSMPLVAQSGTSFINAIERDDQNHIIKAYYTASPAVAYTAKPPWLALVLNEFEHGTAAAGTSMTPTNSTGASFINALERDDQNHIIDAYYTAAPAYTALTPWITLSASEFQHTVADSGTSMTPTNSTGASFINALERDAQNHIIDAYYTAAPAAPAYGASLPWISLNGSSFEHGTATTGTAYSSAGLFMIGQTRDAQNHILSESFGGLSGDAPWISINGYQVVHGTTLGGTHNISVGAGSAIGVLQLDDRNHVIGVSAVP